MSTKILCGPCGYEDNTKNAKKWCTSCEEGFCEDCQKVHRSTKMSRNHKLISVSDYQKIKDVSISQTCVGHGKRYDLYCSLHDKPLCIDCVDQHKSCSQLVSLDKVAANAKQSTALADLEDTISGALNNVGKCIKNQEKSGIEFDKQESLIKKTIQKTREKLNQHLDLLEQKLIQNLSTKNVNCKSAYGEVLHQLYLADKKLNQLKREIGTMKQMASDVQVFLGTREINKTVSEEIKSIKSILSSTKYFEIKLEINPSVTSLFEIDNELGIVSLTEKKSRLEFKDVKLDQAQKHIAVHAGSSNLVIDLQLKQKVRIGRSADDSGVTGCLILHNGNILILDILKGNRIMEYDGQGQFVRYISCSGDPYYSTLIAPDQIAVTYFSMNKIEIIHLSITQVQKIRTTNQCEGISYRHGKLYVVMEEMGIVVLELSGKILYTVTIDFRYVSNIATSKDRIYYTNERKNTIHCLSLTGQEIWEYQNESIALPKGIAVADNQDVFVVGY
ncbi:uncharacterized protein LOC127705657 [Mytilus californianus]|uniref:uncharacterized protein LOC127705657 n=1 Tax=Mytilus californianus TaxID=6549 RepID=UPI0022456FF4|nr:uncharacterized protein LOC127705657 [Mytilus californianus]